MAIIPTSLFSGSQAPPGNVPLKRRTFRSQAEPGNERQDTGFRVQGSSLIPHPSSLIPHPSSLIPHPSSFILHPSRPGFTLIEVLLTLCLLVIIGSLAWPQLDRIFTTQRLRKAADMIRIQWSKARVEAMSTGGIRVFRYEIEGNKYRLDGLAADFSTLESGTTTDPLMIGGTQLILAENTGSAQNISNLNGSPANSEKTLPKDVFFVAAGTVLDTRAAAAINSMSSAAAMPTDISSSAGNTSSSGAAWSQPIFFYPDGTTSTATLLLRNKEGRMIELFIRGLTGIVKVGNVTTAAQGQGNL